MIAQDPHRIGRYAPVRVTMTPAKTAVKEALREYGIILKSSELHAAKALDIVLT
jgi:hypothetical protein